MLGHGQWARVRFCRRGVTPDRMVCLLHVNSRTPPSDEKSLFDSFATTVGRTTRAARPGPSYAVIQSVLFPASSSQHVLLPPDVCRRPGKKRRAWRLIARVFPPSLPSSFPPYPTDLEGCLPFAICLTLPKVVSSSQADNTCHPEPARCQPDAHRELRHERPKPKQLHGDEPYRSRGRMMGVDL